MFQELYFISTTATNLLLFIEGLILINFVVKKLKIFKNSQIHIVLVLSFLNNRHIVQTYSNILQNFNILQKSSNILQYSQQKKIRKIFIFFKNLGKSEYSLKIFILFKKSYHSLTIVINLQKSSNILQNFNFLEKYSYSSKTWKIFKFFINFEKFS
jgi:hypothetical protein